MKNLAQYLTESSFDPGRIFIIVKPGFAKLTHKILEEFESEGWYVEKSRPKVLTLKEAKKLYDIHKKEEWYEPLCEYMSSDISTAFILRSSAPMDKHVFEDTGKIKDRIREKYGESDMRNVIHSSDSYEHMKHEMSVYFPV